VVFEAGKAAKLLMNKYVYQACTIRMQASGTIWAPPAGSGAKPQPKSNLVHF